jgi:hypothetical protein
MPITYTHLSYEEFKRLEQQCRAFEETTHKTTEGFHHKSLRIDFGNDSIHEYHGPLVGGYGHEKEQS